MCTGLFNFLFLQTDSNIKIDRKYKMVFVEKKNI